MLDQWEHFVGRTFDESGFRFLLLYNDRFRHFMWALDEEIETPWRFEPLGGDLLLHPNSSFVFIDGRENQRKTLVGVYAWNMESNNYYDGPFDQLPDNFIDKTSFKTWAEEAYPEVKDLINERGEFLQKEERLAITPYMVYGSLKDVQSKIADCRTKHPERASLYSCVCSDSNAESDSAFRGTR